MGSVQRQHDEILGDSLGQWQHRCIHFVLAHQLYLYDLCIFLDGFFYLIKNLLIKKKVNKPKQFPNMYCAECFHCLCTFSFSYLICGAGVEDFQDVEDESEAQRCSDDAKLDNTCRSHKISLIQVSGSSLSIFPSQTVFRKRLDKPITQY